MAPPRKAKKSKTSLAFTSALGLPAQGGYIEKDATELELEEAVFGRSRAGKGSVWDDLDDVKSSNKRSRFDEPEEEEEVETGLERLRDDNVGLYFSLLLLLLHRTVSCRAGIIS
jgi:hypothetical protein